METLENQQVALLKATDYRWCCGQIQTQLQLQMQLWGRPLWLDTWCRDVSAEQLLVSAKSDKNRCSQENLSGLDLALFLLKWPELCWKRKAMERVSQKEQAMLPSEHSSHPVTQVTASHDGWCSILCWPRCQQRHPCHCLGNHLSKTLQPAGSPDCFPKW